MDWKHAEDYSVPDPLQEPGHAERDYYLNQKKASAKDMAIMMFNTATLR